MSIPVILAGCVFALITYGVIAGLTYIILGEWLLDDYGTRGGLDPGGVLALAAIWPLTLPTCLPIWIATWVVARVAAWRDGQALASTRVATGGPHE